MLRWKAALARSKPNACTRLATKPGMLPGVTCSPTSKATTIVGGSILPSGISLPNRQSAKLLDPVSTKSGEGHLIPSREDQLTRHQEAGGMDIGLPLHPLLSLA